MSSLPQLDLDKISVLVVDSIAHHRNLVTALLRGHGVNRLRLAENAAEGMDLLRRFEFSVVLTEWENEGVDGLSFCREVRRNDDVLDRATPIIVVTSKAARQDVEAARNAGVNEYVIRPVSAHSVISRLNEVMLRPRPFIESPTYIGPCRRRKKAANYNGPMRRITDPLPECVEEGLAEDGRRKAQARRALASLAACAQDVVPGDRVQLRRLHAAVNDFMATGRALGDTALERSAQSLTRYLDGMGASARLEPQVVQTHIEAIARLIELPHAARDLRDRVAGGLHLVVTKKLRGELAPDALDDIVGAPAQAR